MANGFLELPDAKLLSWAKSFGRQVSADPVAYGLDESDTETFDARFNAFSAAMAAQAATQSRVTTIEKNQARAALLKEARLLVSKVNGCRAVTDADRVGLGIPVRSRSATIDAPAEAPFLAVQRVDGNTITLSVGRSESGRGRPYGAIGITLYYATGDTASPASPSAWQFAGNHSARTVEITLPAAHAPGTTVMLSACWLSTRLEAGPMSHPTHTRLQFGTAPDMRRMAA